MTKEHWRSIRNGDMGNTATTAGATFTDAGVASSGGADTGVGIKFMYRWPHQLKRGVVINNATLNIAWSVKDGAQAHSATHVVTAHAHGNSPQLTHGAVEYTRPTTTASVTWNASWPAGQSGTQNAAINVTAIVQEIVNRGDFQPGGYITFILTCTAETNNVNLKFYNDFDLNPYCTVDYTENPAEKSRWDVNIVRDGLFETDTYGDWYFNNLYATYTDTGGTWAFDPTMRRTNGRGSLRWTTEAPQDTRRAGIFARAGDIDTYNHIFFGWIYIPSYVTSTVRAGFAWNGSTHTTITGRDEWVPFCSNPGPINTQENVWRSAWAVVEVLYPWSQGWNIWLSDVGMMRSNVRQYPFTTNDTIPHQDISAYKTSSTLNNSQTVRQSRCRTFVREQREIMTGVTPVISGTGRYAEYSTYQRFTPFINAPIDVSVDIKVSIPASINVYPYQNSGVSIANSRSFSATTSWQTFTFTDTIKDWTVTPTYTLGAIGFYDSVNAGNIVEIRNLSVKATAPMSKPSYTRNADGFYVRSETRKGA